jgi:emfourin
VVVRLQRSGGLAGFTIRSEVDSARLAPADRAQLDQLLDQADLTSSPPRPRGADRFQYDLEVERGGQVQRTTAYDGALPPGFQPLIDWLAARR